MSKDYNAVQESIKIALDAADAATDVTAEYNKIRRDHKKLEKSMNQSQRFISIIFASSVIFFSIKFLYFAKTLDLFNGVTSDHFKNASVEL